MHSVKRLAHIDFNVPGVKAVGMELMKQLNSPEPDMELFARTVELDPAIFGSILACANSPCSQESPKSPICAQRLPDWE